MTPLMKEWPTRVRTGTPPARRMVSGTARLQIRLCTTAEPGSRRRNHFATMAVTVLPGQGAEGVVHEEGPVGVAVEGHPQVGALPPHEGFEVAQVLRAQGVGMVVGEAAVGLQVQADQSRRGGGRRRRARATPATPLPPSAATRNPASREASTMESRWST